MTRYELMPIDWMGGSRAAIRDFPRAVRAVAGDELFRLQIGLNPEHWRSMSNIGTGVREIRISSQTTIPRAVMAKATRTKVRRETTTGTAYEALGFSREEAIVFAMRVLIAEEISRYVKRRRMTQTKAAGFFGVSQPRISNVLNGKLEGFTVDLLLRMVSKTGRVPKLTFRGARAEKLSTSERRAA